MFNNPIRAADEKMWQMNGNKIHKLRGGKGTFKLPICRVN